MMELDIKNYIEMRVPELQGCLFPVHTKELDHLTVAYSFLPTSLDYVSQVLLELRLIAETYDEAKEMEKKLDGALAFKRDEPYRIFGETRFYSVRSGGGGTFFNQEYQRYEHTIMYIINWKELN